MTKKNRDLFSVNYVHVVLINCYVSYDSSDQDYGRPQRVFLVANVLSVFCTVCL